MIQIHAVPSSFKETLTGQSPKWSAQKKWEKKKILHMSLNSLLLITLLKSLTGKAMENRILMADLKIMLPILCLSTHSIRSGCQWYSNGGFNLPANSLLPSDRGQQRSRLAKWCLT